MVLSKDLQGEWLPVRNPHHLERRRRRSNPSSERRPLDSRNNRLLSYLSKSLTSRLLHSAACLSCKRCRRPLPCIPLAVVKVLEYLQIYNTVIPYGNRLFGKTITVINRSEVVGRPLAALLANDGAHVYSVDLDGVQLLTRGTGIK